LKTDSASSSSITSVLLEPLHLLLVALPVAVALEWSHAPGLWVFVAAGLAIIPLAGLMGRATENLSEVLGAGLGGLLNATLGNAAELIIAVFALWKGPAMYPLVKASITGSIVGNVLLILGLSMLVGGSRYTKQTFNATAANLGSTLLGLAAISLIIPSIFFEIIKADTSVKDPLAIAHLSEEIAVVLIVVYVLSLIFSLRTHKHLFAGDEAHLPTTGEKHQPEWKPSTAMSVLLVATVGVAWMAEILVGAVEPACEAIGMNSIFVGVIVIAIVGNAAEHSTAVLMAWKNKMDLAVNIAIGSSIQVALLVAPILVFTSVAMGHPTVLDLHFSLLEVISVVIAVGALALVAPDGQTHWMEGVMLLAVYLILGLAFFHLPVESAPLPHH
jgi:Ca2+:H+ antiporter